MDKIIFPKDVEIGKYYKVPHIMCYEFHGGIVNVWIPINTPLHTDVDYIKFNHEHFHVDWRFLEASIYKAICIDKDVPDYEVKSQVKDVVCIRSASRDKVLADTKIVYKTVKCKRKYINNSFHNYFPLLYKSWPTELQKGYCGEHLRINENGQYVCPHKGAIIDLKHVDENGNAVCPAHLLRFDTKKLKAI